MFKAYICVRPWDLVLTVPFTTIRPQAAGLMTPVGSYLRTSYIIISHNISFNCSLHVPNCSCYQSRPCKYRLIEVCSSLAHISLLIRSVLLFSRVLLSVVDLTLFFDWPCATLSLVQYCVTVQESSLLIARLALIVSVYRCYSCLLFVAFFVLFFSLFSILCFFVFLFFLRKFESGRESRDGLVVILRAHMTPSLCEIESAVCAIYNCQWSELILKG